MEPIMEVAIVLALTAVMSVAAYYLGMLTASGAAASFATGSVVGIFGGLDWFILMFIFTVTGFAATRVGFLKKKRQGLQEGRHGERTHMNVLGVGIAPCLFAIMAFAVGDDHSMWVSIGFISTLCVAAADTIASELGVKDKRVWMITTFKEVPAGTDGGISVLGTFLSIVSSGAVAVLGWVVIHHTIDPLMLIPALAGFVGCMMDSVFGATIETRGYISKYVNNASTAIIGAVFAMLISWPFI